MSMALSKTLQVMHENTSFIQSTPIIMSMSLPIEEGSPIVTVSRKHRIPLLSSKKEIAKELFNHVLKYAKRREGLLTLKETSKIINDFIKEHHNKILEYIRNIAQDKLRGIIEVRDSNIEVINKEKYINIILETYEDVMDSLSALILRALQKRNEGKIVNISAYIKIVYSLTDILSLAKTCIEINRTYHRILELIGILNVIVTVVLLRDLAILRIAEKINEDSIMLAVNEELQVIKIISKLMLDPDKILS